MALMFALVALIVKMKEKIGYDFDDIVKGVQARMSKKTPEPGEETVQLDVFSAEVIPLLQRRGLFRTEYTGTTLREHYGLPLPASAFEDPAKRGRTA